MDITAAISQGTANPAVIIAAALLLGALHGLEPGHSKTMMAAFIIAVRGSVGQAILLGLSAAVSHSLVVWMLAILALEYGNELIGEEMEPMFAIASGVLIIGVAGWVFLQTWFERRGSSADGAVIAGHHHHDYDPHHPHAHYHDHAHEHHHDVLHAHTHAPGNAHARAHATEIEKRFADGRTTTWQTIVFGLTGGLIPCAAAIPVLILCLQLGQFWLGIGLVSAFSVGLAVTLVAAGIAAAIGVRYVSKRSRRLDGLFRTAPYISAVIIGVIGVVMIYAGLNHSHVHPA